MIKKLFGTGHVFGTQSFGNFGEHEVPSMVGVSSDVEVVSKKSENMVVLSSSQNPSGRNVPFLPNNRCPANTAISIQGTKANTQKNIQNRTSFVVKRCLAFFRNSTSTKKNAMTKNVLRYLLLSTSALL